MSTDSGKKCRSYCSRCASGERILISPDETLERSVEWHGIEESMLKSCRRAFLSPPFGGSWLGVPRTQGSLRIALGYILSPPRG